MNNKDVSTGEWIICEILSYIPIVNLVMLCIWAFGSGDTPVSKKNWAKARLITWIISIVIIFAFYLFIMSAANMFLFGLL